MNQQSFKYNRKYDNLYFLLPNTGFIVKYDCCLLFLTFNDYGLRNSYNLLIDSNSNLNPLDKTLSDYISKEEFETTEVEMPESNKLKIEANYETNITPNIIKQTQLIDLKSKLFEKLFIEYNFLFSS